MTHNTAVYVFVEKLMIMLSSIYPNFRKFTTSVMDHVPNKKITKTVQIWFFMYKILVLQKSGTSLQLPTGRIPVTELEGLLNVLLQGQAYTGHWITKS